MEKFWKIVIFDLTIIFAIVILSAFGYIGIIGFPILFNTLGAFGVALCICICIIAIMILLMILWCIIDCWKYLWE